VLRLNAPARRSTSTPAGTRRARRRRRRVGADLVVCNGDVAWTYRHLIDARHRPRNSDRKLERLRYSMSLFLVYFGTRRTYPDLTHHTILLGPRYEGLLDDIFRHKRLAPDLSLYLHAPTRSDPSLAPPGCEAFYVLWPVPNLAGDVDWSSVLDRYRDAIYDRLERTCVPDLRRHLVTERVLTPEYFHTELWSHLAPRSASSRGCCGTRTSAANRCPDVALFFVGAGTPGAGIPACSERA
jgi:phytoene desaturase